MRAVPVNLALEGLPMSCKTNMPGPHGEAEVCPNCYARACNNVDNLRKVIGSMCEKMETYGDRLKRHVGKLEGENDNMRRQLRDLRSYQAPVSAGKLSEVRHENRVLVRHVNKLEREVFELRRKLQARTAPTGDEGYMTEHMEKDG